MRPTLVVKILPSLAASSLAVGLAQAQYSQVNLVSDGAVSAQRVDTHLKNPWGIAMSPTGPFWVVDNMPGVSTVYNWIDVGIPVTAPLVVTIPPLGRSAPTGIVYNGGPGFVIHDKTLHAPSRFIFVTERGTILGWNSDVNKNVAIQAIDNLFGPSNYKAVALANNPTSRTWLYATNFARARVDVFASNWKFAGSFTDPKIPAGYAPFGIKNIDGFLVVTFAKVGTSGDDDPGAGRGFVDVFRPDGTLVKRLVSKGPLNSPWGIAKAPRGMFGKFGGDLLIGNFGDGKINAFNMKNGEHKGAMMKLVKESPGKPAVKKPIVIDGLWELTFGNGFQGGDVDKLYFTAGVGDEKHGLFGYIEHGK